SLESLAHCLDAVAPADAEVDLPRLYRDAAQRDARRARRWRIAAVGFGVTAALLLLVFGLRLEGRVEAHQGVLRWGAVPEPVAPAPLPVIVRQEVPPTVSVEEVLLLKELVHALAADVESSERRQLESAVRLQQRLDQMQRQTQRQWSDTERDV